MASWTKRLTCVIAEIEDNTHLVVVALVLAKQAAAQCADTDKQHLHSPTFIPKTQGLLWRYFCTSVM